MLQGFLYIRFPYKGNYQCPIACNHPLGFPPICQHYSVIIHGDSRILKYRHCLLSAPTTSKTYSIAPSYPPDNYITLEEHLETLVWQSSAPRCGIGHLFDLGNRATNDNEWHERLCQRDQGGFLGGVTELDKKKAIDFFIQCQLLIPETETEPNTYFKNTTNQSNTLNI